MKKVILPIFILVSIMTLLGCLSVKDSGVGGAVQSYIAEESGEHWTRPREITYEIGDIIEHSISIDENRVNVSEAAIFGYPQPGEKANRYVSYAAAQLVAQEKADGILITNYVIERQKSSKIVSVRLQGRPLKMVDLGVVDQERADKNRFMVVIEENSETGESKEYTMPISDRRELPSVEATASKGGLSKGAWIAIDLGVFVAAGASGGLLIAAELGAVGIPLAALSASALIKLVIDIAR